LQVSLSVFVGFFMKEKLTNVFSFWLKACLQ